MLITGHLCLFCIRYKILLINLSLAFDEYQVIFMLQVGGNLCYYHAMSAGAYMFCFSYCSSVICIKWFKHSSSGLEFCLITLFIF